MLSQTEVSMQGVRVRSLGQGQAVLLISGLGGLASFWEPVMDRLSEAYRVVSFDHPGVGGSEPVAGQCIENIVGAAVGILDELEITSANIVGHSTGSLVAQAIGLDHAERARSLVLSSGWGAPDRRFKDLFQFRKTVLQTQGIAEYRRLGNLLAFPSARYNAMTFPMPKLDPAQAEVTASRIDMLLGYSRLESLHRIDCPVLVIGAEDDWIVPYHHAVQLAQAIPGASLQEFSGGHFAPQTRPKAYAEQLTDFFQRAS